MYMGMLYDVVFHGSIEFFQTDLKDMHGHYCGFYEKRDSQQELYISVK